MRKTQARKVKKFPQYKEPINILKEVQKKKKRFKLNRNQEIINPNRKTRKMKRTDNIKC